MGKPDAPDYVGAAKQTAAADKEMLASQTQANRPNQVNPWGEVSWAEDENGNWTQTTNLNDKSQSALDSELNILKAKNQLGEGMMGRMEDEFGQKMDWDNFGGPTSLEYNPDEIRERAEDAAYTRASGRLDQRFGDSDTSLEVSLRNRGLQEGDEAYDSAMANQAMAKTDAYGDAQNAAVGQGRQEAAQMFEQQKQSADYANNLRQSQMTEEMKKRGFSLNEINAIISGEQVAPPEFQSFMGANKGQGVDYSGAANSKGNFDQGTYQGLMTGISGVAGAGMGMMG